MAIVKHNSTWKRYRTICAIEKYNCNESKSKKSDNPVDAEIGKKACENCMYCDCYPDCDYTCLIKENNEDRVFYIY